MPHRVRDTRLRDRAIAVAPEQDIIAATLKETAMRHPDFVPHGVIPAVLLPFHEDLSIDEASFRSHLRDVGSVQGLSAITINAHSTEVASCTEDEQRRVMEIAGEELADPFIDMHNRMKEALVLLGKLPRAIVRPPLVKITDAEIARIREALIEAGLLGAREALGRDAA
jgi:dihydrodipicolinate synthase/N-acetylneuraminate lyase